MSSIASKRILITGGAGFLGSHVANELRRAGCKQLLVFRSSEYDLRNPAETARLFRDTGPQIVIHLAAVVGGIGANRDNPGKFFYDNLMMGVEVIEQARLHNIEKLVAIGTVCAYPKFTPIPFREEELWNGYPEETNAPYGIAKKMLLVQAQAYREQYGLNSIYLLPVNLYGPGDSFDPEKSHVIPALIKKCFDAMHSGADHIEVWGTGTASREFLYVEDCARAIVLATQNYEKPDPINLGAGREISIRDLAELICELSGFHGEIRWDASKPDGQPRRCLDVTKAHREFGFRAETDFRAGLHNTIEWYRNRVAGL
ncbi:MAG TPA: GDP-L-fucose synthase [Candidatus Binataceae bacterium]|nr:GDP-L-fucose synthase [Candidatus Binataceae bacterium]